MQITKDFGPPEAALSNRLRQTDIEEGREPGQTKGKAAGAGLRCRNRLLENENEVPRNAAVHLLQAKPALGGPPK